MAYRSLYTGNLKDNEPADLIMVMNSALEVGDIWTAQAAPARLVNDHELYGESLYLLGMYYLREGQHEAAFDFFAKASREASGSTFAERAKIEIAEIHVKEKRYSEAVEVLGGISDPALDDRKTALLIISWFGTGKTREAVELTNRSIGRLMNIPLGEAVVMENLLHYYRLKDLEKFNLYAGYLNRYTGNGPVINHLAGKLHFEIGHYGTAYYYFYKLSQAESEYREEAYYLMGTISLVEQKNRNLAAGYYKKLSEIGRRDNPFVLRAKLNLSILLNEAGDVDSSKKVLTDLLAGSEGVAVKAQAENLWRHFGYSK
jgi:tetratricopeptide (TPR) repeat protein